MTITCALIQMVKKAAGKTGKARIVTKACVTQLIVSGGACTGCIYEKSGATFKECGPVIFPSGVPPWDVASSGQSTLFVK